MGEQATYERDYAWSPFVLLEPGEWEVASGREFADLVKQMREVEQSRCDAILCGLYTPEDLDGIEAECTQLISQSWGALSRALNDWWPAHKRFGEPH